MTKPTAAKRGRNPRFPYVPIIQDGSRTSQIRGFAFATRDEALTFAARHIDKIEAHHTAQMERYTARHAASHTTTTPQESPMATAHEFTALLDSITTTALRERVEDSAICNARDTMREIGRDSYGWNDDSEYWIVAINTAKMCIDCARDFYPELFAPMTQAQARALAKLDRSYRARHLGNDEWCVWQDSADHRVEFDSATIARLTTTTTTQQESHTMGTAYWILATRESDGKWHMQFGDYARDIVQFERNDYRSTYAAKNLRVVRCTDSWESIDAAIAALNG
jgi:hypothetical protein